MKKLIVKKLSLNKATISNLERETLKQIKGGSFVVCGTAFCQGNEDTDHC
ncbi:MAG: rSAM-modified peptide [bacterium]|nr:rSAM-modified peptide [bacterium]